MAMGEAGTERAERGRVTLQVIADELAVSTATVSLALRDSPVVALETKQRVQRLARDLGYIYNRSAASLRTADGGTAHTGCVAFGIDRLAVALFFTHGTDIARWPQAIKKALDL